MDRERRSEWFELVKAIGSLKENLSVFFKKVQIGEVPKAYVLSVLAVAAMFIILYIPIIPWWIKHCSDPEGLYGHAFLIPFVSLWLLWQNRKKLSQVTYKLCPQALWLVAVGLFIHLFGVFVEAKFIVFLSLVVVLIGLLWMWLGTEFIRAAWFPLAFLFFAVPLDPILTKLSVPLQMFSARLAGAMVGLTGIPVLVSGAQLSTSKFGVLVIPDCSGLKYTVSLLALSTLIAMQVPGALWKSVLVVSALPVAMLANAIRITTVTLIGQWWGKEAATGFYHNISGVFIFAIAFAMFMGLAILIGQETKLGQKPRETEQEAQNEQQPPIATPYPHLSLPKLNGWVVVLLGLTLLLGTGIQRVYDIPYEIDLRKIVPAEINEWKMVEERVSHYKPEKNWIMWRTYEASDGRRLLLHAVATPGWRGMRDYEACLAAEGWNPLAHEKTTVNFRNGASAEAKMLWMNKPHEGTLLSLYIYLSNGEPTVNFYYIVWRSLTARRSKDWLGTLQFEVRMLTNDGNAEETLRRAKEFLVALCQPLVNAKR
ncbi:MAG: exosortase/archaeosortase family protein [Armatimonadota bacterium]|nr:exosortase/archaeosortase family protein [Armatimonadota bacterium]MDW8143640.1 exosortase/archaeosortase family protein [Armatimonadota bacterium]